MNALMQPEVLAPLVAGLAALVAGIFLGPWLFGTGRLRRNLQQLQEEMKQADREHLEVVRAANSLRADADAFSRFLIHMPDFARQINQDSGRRNVYRDLANVLQNMFEPRQVTVFTQDRGGHALLLQEGRGLPESFPRGQRLELVTGRIAWVAEHQVAMAGEDFLAQSRVGATPLGTDHPALQVDLAAPMVHDEKLIGVITVGGLSRHPRGEKQMIKMAADLGAIALNNAQLFESIRRTANHDGLTGLANKRFFMQQLGIMINEAETSGRSLSVFIFDIDHFKSYNDQNGHLAGDELLRRISRLLRETVRDDDLPARYGGEEFIVVLPDTNREGAVVVAEKFRRVVEEFHFPNQQNQPNGNVTVSGGVAAFPLDGRSSTELIAHADQALYAAKAQGRNLIVAFRSPEFGDDTADLIEHLGA